MPNPVDQIDAQVVAKHLLTHPFYQAWTRGELSRSALQDYAKQYYHHVAAFPTYLSAVHANMDDQPSRRQVLANLMDEEGGDPHHPELWLRFAESTGLSREEAQSAALWPETRDLIATFRDICRNGTPAQGLAALYAYESQIPAVSESKIDGLRKHYGIDDERGLSYFHVHIEADREHAAAERALLETHVDARNEQVVNASVDRVLDALWGMLDGVCRRHGVACQ